MPEFGEDWLQAVAMGETTAGREAHGEVTERDERYPEEGLGGSSSQRGLSRFYCSLILGL